MDFKGATTPEWVRFIMAYNSMFQRSDVNIRIPGQKHSGNDRLLLGPKFYVKLKPHAFGSISVK